MDNEKELPKRKRLRLKNFDYSAPGAYFVTVCTHNRNCTLSHIVGAIHESPEIQLTEYGKIVDRLINTISRQSLATIDRYVIMPNHIHLVIIITDSDELRAIRESPLRHGITCIYGYVCIPLQNTPRECYNQNFSSAIFFSAAIPFLYPFSITHSIITQIGRENNSSADIFVPANSPLRTTEKWFVGFFYDLQGKKSRSSRK